ncbi:OmpH family outer membrane protein [Niabella insulamsoli]|uniref:OmpH family outer membrane protein n=1 Tax=Niabella insulamsoli TaxID=3144874 RepID=UPI0031FE39CD
MKQALIIVNALLVIAVSYLLYKQFAGKPETGIVARETVKTSDSTAGKLLFAYMNMDSIQNKYELAKAVTNEVERRRESLDAEINRMQKALRNKLEGYQQRAATMTEEQAVAAREDMANSEREMMDKRQALADEYQNWLASKNMSVIKDIQDYLKKFNADGTYSFIFSHEPFFYYTDTAYDITSEVVKGLNEQYKAKKRK